MTPLQSAIYSAADDLAKVIAKRIAIQSQTDPISAAKEYQQHVSAMSADEKRIFAGYVATFAAQLQESQR